MGRRSILVAMAVLGAGCACGAPGDGTQGVSTTDDCAAAACDGGPEDSPPPPDGGGDCPECEDACVGPAPGCDDWAQGATSGVVETAEGWLTLDGTIESLHVIWPSSAGRGDVFRVDTRTQEIQGAYWTGPNHGDAVRFQGDSPSRSAVDDRGNLFIANRALGGDRLGSVTKIAASPDDCPDRDLDGRVDTSSSWDDRLAFDSQDAWEDECILWHSVVGAPDAIPRAILLRDESGLDGARIGRVWVGLYGEERFVELDADSGEPTGVVAPTPGFHPYGAAVDRDGWVWAAGMSLTVGRFDTADPEDSFEEIGLPLLDRSRRILVDENDAPWVSTDRDVYRWSRDREEWDAVGLSERGGFPVGNIASDGRGSVWAGTSQNVDPEVDGGAIVFRIENDLDLGYRTIDTLGVDTFGIAVDFDETVWAIGEDGRVVLVDADTEEAREVLDDCDGPCLQGPYVRGDVTGLQRRNALDSYGEWSTVFDGCAEAPVDWETVAVDARVPAGTAVEVAVRTADTLEALGGAAWVDVGTLPPDPASLDLDAPLAAAGVPDARLLEVRVALRSLDHVGAPVLRQVQVEWRCEHLLE